MFIYNIDEYYIGNIQSSLNFPYFSINWIK